MTTNPNIASVKCEACGSAVTVDLETEEVSRESKQMGAEVQYDTNGEETCVCGNEIVYSESEWEYPEGEFNHREGPNVKGGTLL